MCSKLSPVPVRRSGVSQPRFLALTVAMVSLLIAKSDCVAQRPLIFSPLNSYLRLTQADTSGPWFGLFPSANDSELIMRQVYPRFTAPTHDSWVRVIPTTDWSSDSARFERGEYDRAPDYLFAHIPALKPFTAKRIFVEEGGPIGDPPMGSDSLFESNLAIGKGGNVIQYHKSAHSDSSRSTGNWMWRRYQVMLTHDKLQQTIDRGTGFMYAGSIQWVGDLDGDGKPDMIFGPHSDNPQDCSLELWLSSSAGPNEILHRAADCQCEGYN